MTTVIERSGQPRTEATSGRLRRPESEASPAWFLQGAGKDVIQADLNRLTLGRQAKLDLIQTAEQRRVTGQKPLADAVGRARSAVALAQQVLDNANLKLRQARGALVSFDGGIDSEVESARRALARSRDPQIREFLGWCDQQHALTLEHASAKITQTGEEIYNLESGMHTTPVSIDYTKTQSRLRALIDAKVKVEKELSYVADADVGERLAALREAIPAL